MYCSTTPWNDSAIFEECVVSVWVGHSVDNLIPFTFFFLIEYISNQEVFLHDVVDTIILGVTNSNIYIVNLNFINSEQSSRRCYTVSSSASQTRKPESPRWTYTSMSPNDLLSYLTRPTRYLQTFTCRKCIYKSTQIYSGQEMNNLFHLTHTRCKLFWPFHIFWTVS